MDLEWTTSTFHRVGVRTSSEGEKVDRHRWRSFVSRDKLRFRGPSSSRCYSQIPSGGVRENRDIGRVGQRHIERGLYTRLIPAGQKSASEGRLELGDEAHHHSSVSRIVLNDSFGGNERLDGRNLLRPTLRRRCSAFLRSPTDRCECGIRSPGCI